VSWAKFCDVFHAHYILASVMRKKRQEFMYLKQGGRSVHDYSKQFNHLTQYVPNQVDTDEKKKHLFMIGFSTMKMLTSTRYPMGKNTIRSWVWVIFYTHGYVNRGKVISDGYNGFGYGNHEPVPVYPCIRIKL
jgi:hypothetical protein